ncbi:MAG: glycosyltransferase family 61 protein [Rickettsiales bacterium]|jgi:capsular polysaccharide biosynthesis protein|nr:glycosyltransferase family 61 protein [Rickettsiales bacterium]
MQLPKDFYKYNPDMREWFDKNAIIDYIRTEPLEIKAVPKGIIAPYAVLKQNETAAGGVFDANKQLVAESVFITRGTLLVSPDRATLDKQVGDNGGKIPHMGEDVIYCGSMPNHFGHILTDVLSYLWPLLDEKYRDKKIAFLLETEAARKFANIVALFGIPLDRILFIHKPVSFDTVFVIQPAQFYNFANRFPGKTHYVHPLMRDIYNRIVDKVRAGGGKPKFPIKKVYLSRTRLKAGIMTFGEKSLEGIFAKNGYTVIYPETMSFADQIRVVMDADSLACVQGTLLHFSMFMRDGAELLVFERGHMEGNGRQCALNQLKKINATYISASRDVWKYSTTQQNFCPHMVGDTPFTRQFFKDNNFIFDEKDFGFDYLEYLDYIVDLGRASNFDMHAQLTDRARKFEKK